MKIIIERNQGERQTPIVTIDTETCHYPLAIRNAIELALEIDGYSKETINEVFGRMEMETINENESCTKSSPNWDNDIIFARSEDEKTNN